jgi:hypothetical protein
MSAAADDERESDPVMEKPIKVDEQTDRIVSDLAHFLRSTKKSVVRDAVAEYAESRHALMPIDVGSGGVVDGEGVVGVGESGTGESGPGIAGLSPMQRLALRKNELIREFARHRGTNIRVLQASDTEDDEITLLADTDVIDGGAAVPRLEEIAHRLLATHVTVISTTALSLMQPETYQRALAESHPL